MARLEEKKGITGSPEGKFSLAMGYYGGCSSHFLSGFYPAYGGEKGGQVKYTIPKSVAMSVAIVTDGQEEDLMLVKELKAAGYVKILGCRTTHGVYDCNLWVCEPRGKGVLNLPKPEYSIRLNPELFAAGDDAKALKELTKNRDEAVKAYEAEEKLVTTMTAKLAALEEKLDDAKRTIAEQKIALSQKRLLRKRKTSLNPADTKAEGRLIPRKKGLSTGMRSKRPSV